MTDSKWIRVSRAEPCPICGHGDYCTRTIDGIAVKCMRVDSSKPVKSGGWIHRMSEPLPTAAPKKVEKKRDWTAECKRMYGHRLASGKRLEIAKQLGVGAEALKLLRVGIGWDKREFSSWPSRDHTGKCIGYVRRYDDGTKRTNRGGSTGVFYTANWCKHSGPLFIVEGGSDVAACETYGLCAIGRASNVFGGYWIGRMIRRTGKEIIVVGERDAKPEKRGEIASCPLDCGGCAWCWPGKFGMEKVAAELSGVAMMIPEPYKDMRDMLTAVGTAYLDKLNNGTGK